MWFELSEQAKTGNGKIFEELSVQKSNKLVLTYLLGYLLFSDINSLPSKVVGFHLLFVGVKKSM